MRGRRKSPTSQHKRKVVAYVRVSTEEQAGAGVSLAAQEERLRAYGLATRHYIDDVIVDAGMSAKNLARPGMLRILEGLRSREIGAVIVLKLDRLTRSVRDLADLLDAFAASDAALISVSEALDTSTAAGRLMLNLLASVSQWEREAIGERTAFALAHKRRNRQVYGAVPFGYRRDGDTLVPVPAQQAAFTRMRMMHAQGASLRQIAAMLHASGVQPPRGGSRWYASSVRDVLRSKIAREA